MTDRTSWMRAAATHAERRRRQHTLIGNVWNDVLDSDLSNDALVSGLSDDIYILSA